MRLTSLLLPLLLLPLLSMGASSRAVGPDPLQPLFESGLGETRAAMLVVDGRPLARRYAPGYDDRTRFISWSMAKTVTGVLVGLRVADGALALDAPAPVPAWQRAGDPRARITLRQLLTMSSGLRHMEVGNPIEASDTNQVLFVDGTGGMAARAEAAPLAAAPDTRFTYSSLTTVILADLVTNSLTASRDPATRAAAFAQYAQARLFGPLGITSAEYGFDGAGTAVGGSLLYMTLPDFARFAGVLIDGRAPDGRQVVPPAWLAFMRTPAPTNPEYGGQLWLNRPGGVDPHPALFPGRGPATLVSCVGHVGQFAIASPDQRLVLVRLGQTQENDAGAWQRLRAALATVVERYPVLSRAPTLTRANAASAPPAVPSAAASARIPAG